VPVLDVVTVKEEAGLIGLVHVAVLAVAVGTVLSFIVIVQEFPGVAVQV
jgi:hypothetical protein